MRDIVKLLCAATWSMAPVPAFAQAMTAPLSVNEILFTAMATGKDVSPAQMATLGILVSTEGLTAAEARANNRTLLDKILADVSKIDQGKHTVKVTGPAIKMGFIGNEAYSDDTENNPLTSSVAAHFKASNSGRPSTSNHVAIEISDIVLVDQVQDAITKYGGKIIANPEYGLIDVAPARTRAQAAALRLAKDDAQSYASALGLKVVRIARVSEVGENPVGYAEISEGMMARLSGVGSEPVGTVTTSATVWVDFVLAPK